VTIELPRALRPDENVLGECVPDTGTVEGRYCQDVRTFASLPPPTGD
jgi:hypothetical protein